MVDHHRQYPRLVEFLGYWERKRGQRAMPRRRDIDPTEIPHLLPFIQIVEVVSGGQRYRYRLVGTGIVDAFGADTTGRYTDEVASGDRRDFIREFYDAVRTNRRPVFARSRYVTARGLDITASRVLAPLSQDDVEVNQIMGALVFEFRSSNRQKISPTDQIDRARSIIEVL